MIDFIEGTVEKITPDYAVINTGFAGIGIHITARTSEALKREPGAVRLHTYFHVRENVMELYGFTEMEDRKVFMMLMDVNGIGAKSAINVLNKTSAAQLKRAIASGDEAALTRIPGLGGKKAGRIINELQDKFKGLEVLEEGVAPLSGAEDDYIDALTALGFNYARAREAVARAIKDAKDPDNREAVMRDALKRLGR